MVLRTDKASLDFECIHSATGPWRSRRDHAGSSLVTVLDGGGSGIAATDLAEWEAASSVHRNLRKSMFLSEEEPSDFPSLIAPSYGIAGESVCA